MPALIWVGSVGGLVRGLVVHPIFLYCVLHLETGLRFLMRSKPSQQYHLKCTKFALIVDQPPLCILLYFNFQNI